VFLVYFIPPWPWPLTFWPQVVKHSPLSDSASLLEVWWKCVKYSARYPVINVSGRTHGRTDARTNGTKPLCLRPHYVGRRHKNRHRHRRLHYQTPWCCAFPWMSITLAYSQSYDDGHITLLAILFASPVSPTCVNSDLSDSRHCILPRQICQQSIRLL